MPLFQKALTEHQNMPCLGPERKNRNGQSAILIDSPLRAFAYLKVASDFGGSTWEGAGVCNTHLPLRNLADFFLAAAFRGMMNLNLLFHPFSQKSPSSPLPSYF